MYYHAGHGFVPTIPINSNQQTPTFYLAFYVTYILTRSDILSGIEAGEEAGSDVLARKLARWLMIFATWRGEGRRMRKSGKLR
jgi:hypothetical protein